jgi:hypothetical protein
MFEFEIMSESAANKVMSPQRRSVRRERLSGMPRTRMLRHASIMLRFWGSLRPQRLGGAFLQRSHVWNNPRRQASPRIVEGKMLSLAGWVAALRAGETPTHPGDAGARALPAHREHARTTIGCPGTHASCQSRFDMSSSGAAAAKRMHCLMRAQIGLLRTRVLDTSGSLRLLECCDASST